MKVYVEQPRSFPKLTPQKAVQAMVIITTTLSFIEQTRTVYTHYSALYRNRKQKKKNGFGFKPHNI